MSKSGEIQCAKCGHILSLDEIEKKQCNICKAGIQSDPSPTENQNELVYCEEHNNNILKNLASKNALMINGASSDYKK
jgi:hypothetical protein